MPESPQILLVNPPAERVLEPHDTPRFPHIGLAYLAASLERKGIFTTVVDAKFENLTADRTMERIAASPAPTVGFTAFTHEIEQAHRLARAVKSLDPLRQTLVGGVHFTALPQATLHAFPAFDAGLKGEAEDSLPRFLQCAGSPEARREVPGAVLRTPHGFWEHPDLPAPEVSALPFPAWEHFPASGEVPILTARGCPCDCAFCARPYGNRARTRPAGQVLDELERAVHRFKARVIHFHDESFGTPRSQARELLQGIVTRGLNRLMTFRCMMRVSAIDAEMLGWLKAAGCGYVGFGIETADERLMQSMHKGLTRVRAVAAVRATRAAGIGCGTYFIIGHPHETVKSALETVHFACELNADVLALGLMVPYPGSAVYDLAARGAGGYILRSSSWTDFNKLQGDALELATLSRSRMELLQAYGYLRFYLGHRRIADLGKVLWSRRKQVGAWGRNLWLKPLRGLIRKH